MKFDFSLQSLFSILHNRNPTRRRLPHRGKPLPEALESRVVLSSVSVLGNQVVFLAGNGETNDVIVSEAAGTITIQDTTSPITSVSAEYTVVDANTVTIPAAGMNQLNLTLLDGDDTLDASGITVASGLTRTVIQGGSGNDTLIGTHVDDFFIEETGNDSVDGVSAISLDQWTVNSDFDMTLTDAGLTVGPDFDTYQNVGVVNLAGSVGDNVIDASAVTAASGITNGINLNGREGNDTLISGGVRGIFRDILGTNTFVGGANTEDVIAINADADISIDDFSVTVGTSISAHSGIERVDLNGGAGDNIIDASAVTTGSGFTAIRILGFGGNDTLIGSPLDDIILDNGGANFLDGGGGNDLLALQADVDQSLTNTTVTMAADVSTHANFERISLVGGNSDNVLDASALDASSGVSFVAIQGLNGNDTLRGSQVVDEIRSTGGNNFIDGGSSPVNTRDRVVFFDDVDMFASDSSIVVGTGTNTLVNAEDLRLVGNSSDNVLDASGLTTASGVELLLVSGLSGNDKLVPSSDPVMLQSFDGNDGMDELDFSHFLVAPTINITGPGMIDGNSGTFTTGSAFASFINIDEIISPPEYDFSAAAYSSVEGNATNTTTVVQITRSVNTAIASSVEVVLTGDTATAGDDFTVGPITVEFLPGEVTKSVPIELLGDSVVELNETITLSFADGISGAAIGMATLTISNDDVSNLPPQLISFSSDATFANKAEPGDTVSVNATFTDPNAADSHTATIDWGDGTASLGTVNQMSGEIMADHVYVTGGIFDITITIDDGTATDVAMTSAVVSGVRLTNNGTLQIIGTDANDSIQIRRKHGNIRVRSKTGHGPSDKQQFSENSVSSIVIHTCDGNDFIHLDSSISLPATINGGAGNDQIIGGSGDNLIRGGDGNDHIQSGYGNDILLGGNGRDWIFGGSGRDIIIGGDGFDIAFGGSGQDIMIGGSTIHDDNDDTLNQIRNEWTSNKSLSIRRQNLIDGTGDGSGLNGTAFLNSLSLIDDNDFDLLFGGWGTDWFAE